MPKTAQSFDAGDHLITSADARKLAGDVTTMTLWRWVRDGIIPTPINIRGRNYWRKSEFIAGLEVAASAPPAPRPVPRRRAAV